MRIAALIFGTALLAACSADSNVGRTLRAEAKAPHKFDTGDIVRISVAPGQAETYLVDADGGITVPPLGAIAVRGATASDIEADLGARLAATNNGGANLTVEVAGYRPFFAMGEVNSSGQYLFVPGMTVRQAVNAAGGFTAKADQRSVRVTRSIGGEVATAGLKLSDRVMPGDTIYVQARSL